MRRTTFFQAAILALAALPCVLGSGTLSTSGYSVCLANSTVQVQKLDLSYTSSTREVTFDLAGTNEKEQNVTAALTVLAYGIQVYKKTFDPCSSSTFVKQLCPVPSGTFSANGSLQIPEQYASQIPSIAFSIPDLNGQARLKLMSENTGQPVACIDSRLTNGKSMQTKAVSFATVGVTGSALALSGVSALGVIGHAGALTSGPSFASILTWFHSMATNGMLSVDYPSVYRSFSTNFGFSTGLVSWGPMQNAIDAFRQRTGGNLTADNYQYLKDVRLTFPGGSTVNSGTILKRGFELSGRDFTTSISMSTVTGSASTASTTAGEVTQLVSGIKAYVEQLSIPQANTFMTVMLIFAVVIFTIAVGILLLKVVLEAWALYGTFPKSLSEFRKDYWGVMGRTITNLILILYSIWVLYCIYQLVHGDSWAVKALAVVTLVIFTAVLMFFSWKIAVKARQFKQAEGDTSRLYDDKEIWRKYSLFYDCYKKDYWWLFVPDIVYMFAKGCIIAAGDGHGFAQTIGQLIVEGLMLAILLWNRPFVAKSSQWVNITIQVVRVLSAICILVFVEELGISQTTKTITGVILIAVQSGLTGLLAILIVVNGIIYCCRENPYEKRRKESEKLQRDLDNLTPLDSRDSLLMDRPLSEKDFYDPSKLNYANSYEPYRYRIPVEAAGSNDRLIAPADAFKRPYRTPSPLSDLALRNPAPHHGYMV